MKRIYFLIPVVVLSFSFFWSCEKLTDEEKQEIERFKNSPRDSRIIGQWKFKNLENEEFIVIYKLEGLREQALAVYSEKGEEVIKYKKNKGKTYFYTENNEVIYWYIVNRGILGTSYGSYDKYTIEGDSLYMQMGAKGVRVNVHIED